MQGVLPVGSTAAGGVVVPAKTLTQIVLEVESAVVDLLKMDIEGSEYEVIFSTAPDVLRRVRRIALEYHSADVNAPSARERLFAHHGGRLQPAGRHARSERLTSQGLRP